VLIGVIRGPKKPIRGMLQVFIEYSNKSLSRDNKKSRHEATLIIQNLFLLDTVCCGPDPPYQYRKWYGDIVNFTFHSLDVTGLMVNDKALA
jgi:hypothetical protein